MSTQTATELRVGVDGALRIPATLTSRAVLRPGDKVTVRVAHGRLSVAAAADPGELLGRFVRDSDRLLPDVDEQYRMSAGLTVREYLALEESERDVLWQHAMEEALEAFDAGPERDVTADVVPAGQEHRAGGL